jgi:hypothetical protein
MLIPGQCRWCNCTEENACPDGCAWVDRAQTLCSGCAPIEQAWKDQPHRVPNMRRAFFSGFLASGADRRWEDNARVLRSSARDINPYASGNPQHQWWKRGATAGRLVPAGR